MMQDQSDEDEISEDDEEAEGEEEGELEMDEMGESELSESSESVAFDQKLKPRKPSLADSDDDEETTRKKQLIRKLEGDQENQSDDDIDAALDIVIENKTEESKKVQTRQVSDLEKAEAVQTQKKVYNTTLQQRILMQKLLIAANKMPTRDQHKQFIKGNTKLKSLSIDCRRGLKRHLKDLVTAQAEMFKLSETKIDIEEIDVSNEDDYPSDELWQTIDTNFARTLPFIEETIEKWNTRTKLISQTHGQKSSSVFNATIVQQVNTLMSNPESCAKLVVRTQSKRDTFRILGRGADDLHRTKDSNIYNDHEFYQVLLADFLQSQGENDAD